MVKYASSSSTALILLSLLLLIGVPFCASAAQTPGDKFRVKLDISTKGESSGIVQSYVSRALRKLGDVLIVDDDPDYVLSIIVMETRNQAMNLTGYAISSVGTELLTKSLLKFSASIVGVPERDVSLFTVMFREKELLPTISSRWGQATS